MKYIIEEGETVILRSILFALIGTGFTFFLTSLGSALVFLFKRSTSSSVQRFTLGFASGVMIAASVWSLILPALESAEKLGIVPWIPAAVGFFSGGVFLYMAYKFLPLQEDRIGNGDNSISAGNFMLLLAITLHNIPEGMAVGLAFALALSGMDSAVTLASAIALAIGIGIQNFPEGAAIAMPLYQSGKSKGKSFLYGVLSGIVEPIGGVIAVMLVGCVRFLMPWFLSFAAGAMIYVAAAELIPKAYSDDGSNHGPIGVISGFLIMMVLDVALS